MKYYQDINQLPLSHFIDCYVDGNLQSLVISGDVDATLLQGAWLDIQEQYAEAMGNVEQRMFLRLLVEVNSLSSDLNLIDDLVEVMREHYHPSFGKTINKLLKTSFSFDISKREEYDTTLQRCLNRKAGIEMQLEIKQASLTKLAMKMENTAGDKPNRSYFSRFINIIEEHFSIHVDPSFTVARFCDRVKRMTEEIKKNQAKQNGRSKR